MGVVQDNIIGSAQKLAENGKDPSDRIRPITLDIADWSIDPDGKYGVVDGFLAVVDGQDDLLAALETARELIKNPQFQAVAVIRNSQTLTQSFQSIAGMMDVDGKFGLGAIEGRILPWPDKNKYLYINQGMTTIFPHKSLRFGKAEKGIGADFHEIFSATKEVFPEYLSWSVRKLKSGVPGELHYDECYRPGLRNVSDLPRGFVKSVNSEIFQPLSGSITMTTSLDNGGTIVCNSNEILPQQNFYDEDNALLGYQGQNGDLLILRANGWDADQGYTPSFHCPPKVENIMARRYVAVSSSNASFLSPQIREMLGRSRLPSDDPLNTFLDDFDNIRNDTSASLLKTAFLQTSPEILKDFPIEMLDRFPDETVQEILPILDHNG